MTLNEFTKETFKNKEYYNRPSIICNDGFEMSVQGSKTHYSSPRDNSYLFEAMEIGFPSVKEDLIIEYAESKDSPTQTVYGWVPTDIIQKVIDKHGGIDIYKSMKRLRNH